MDGVQKPPERWGETIQKEDSRDVCEALCAMAQLLAQLYRKPFDNETIAYFVELETEDDGDLFMQNDSCRGGAQLVKRYYTEHPTVDDALKARNDFHKLFIGPDKLWAIPWSSCYLDGDSLFGPHAQAVEREFAKFGYEIPEGHHEPSDHIAYEIQFLAELHKKAVEAWNVDGAEESGGPVPEEALSHLREASDFKHRFLDGWTGEFLARVESKSRVDVYRGVAGMTRGYLELEEAFLNLPALKGR